MKKLCILLTIGIVTSFNLMSQGKQKYLTTKLINGYPSEIKSYVSGRTDVRYSELQTNIDTLKVYFGTAKEKTSDLYWVSIRIGSSSPDFIVCSLEKNDSLNIYKSTMDLTFDNTSKKILFEVLRTPQSDDIQYIWLNNDERNDTASITNNGFLQKDKQFPELSFKLLNGNTISTKDFVGKYVVINWWSTTCGPCRLEIPGFNKLVVKYKENKNIIFLAIAQDSKDRLTNYLAHNEYSYIQTLSNDEIDKVFGVGYPKHLIVTPDGKIAFYFVGGFAEMHTLIENELEKTLHKN